jgi:hypothetical protein
VTFVFFLRTGVLALGDEEAELAVAVGAFLFLPAVFVALPPVALSSLGLSIRWMLVAKESPVIGFPSGLKSLAALSQLT